MKTSWRLAIVIITTGMMLTCIDPFSPDLKKFDDLLVVEAVLTDENVPGFVRLARTIRTPYDTPEKVGNALVKISCNDGTETTLSVAGEGYYVTDPALFRGEAGKSYTLYIRTPDGTEYLSDPCILSTAPEIDSVYYSKESRLSDDGSATTDGIQFFIISTGNEGTGYFRWTYDEHWKFEVPYPVKYTYICDTTIIEIPEANKTCWAHEPSTELIIEADYNRDMTALKNKPVIFIPTDESNRFSIRYFFRIRQYSISKSEYEFLDLMRQINETGGDIFEKQPFLITGNINNTSRPGELVPGFFSVAGVKERHIYITPRELYLAGLPLFRYDCKEVIKGEDDYQSLGPGRFTFNEIYTAYTRSGFTFVEPVYENYTTLKKLVFVPTPCADCTVNGTIEPPDFWVDQ